MAQQNGSSPGGDGLEEIALHRPPRLLSLGRKRCPCSSWCTGSRRRRRPGPTCSRTSAERFTVIAPDLLGHGESAKPRGDYSLGAYASGIRDLLIALGHERATFVGHSLGGGVAMQLAYQFPEHCERLVLVASGGLGSRDHAVAAGRQPARAPSSCCRCWSTTGSSAPAGWSGRCSAASDCACTPTWARSCAVTRRSRTARRARRSCTRSGRSSTPGVSGWRRAIASTSPRRSRSCSSGASATRSSRSSTRARRIELVPGSRLEVFPDAGHFPHLDDPLRFVRLLNDFMDTTEPARSMPAAGASCSVTAPERSSCATAPARMAEPLERAVALAEELGSPAPAAQGRRAEDPAVPLDGPDRSRGDAPALGALPDDADASRSSACDA